MTTGTGTATSGIRWRHKGRLAVLVTTAATAGAAAAAAPAVAADAAERETVIVMAQPGAGDAVERAVERLGGDVGRPLRLINGFTARLSPTLVEELRDEPGVLRVTSDRRMTVRASDEPAVDPAASLDVARATVGADADAGAGAGVDVAVLDTGVAPVSGLSGRVVNAPDFSSDAVDADARHLDGFGHGTHMAGIIAGYEPSEGFVGMAPGARIVNVRVADHDGETSLARVLAGIDWVARHGRRDGLNVRVLNLALGGEAAGGYREDPLSFAVERAWTRGVAVIAAAGNGGPDTPALDSPAHDPYLIAAGASDSAGTASPADDSIAEFSSRGAANRMPDVVAPGVGIVSLRVAGSLLDQSFPHARFGERYFRGSGTSQAAAVVSGLVARLAAERPDLGPDELKALLRGTARPLTGTDRSLQGAGLVDVDDAGAATVPADARQHWLPAKGGGRWVVGSAAVQMAVENPDVWTASRWTASRWTASRWTASRWTASRWTASRWTASRWTASRWTADTWDGTAGS